MEIFIFKVLIDMSKRTLSAISFNLNTLIIKLEKCKVFYPLQQAHATLI